MEVRELAGDVVSVPHSHSGTQAGVGSTMQNVVNSYDRKRGNWRSLISAFLCFCLQPIVQKLAMWPQQTVSGAGKCVVVDGMSGEHHCFCHSSPMEMSSRHRQQTYVWRHSFRSHKHIGGI